MVTLQSSSLLGNSRLLPTIPSQASENDSAPKLSFRSKLSPNEPRFETYIRLVGSTRNSSDSLTITFSTPYYDRRNEQNCRRRISPVYGVELLRAQLEGESLHRHRRIPEQGNLKRRRSRKIVSTEQDLELSWQMLRLGRETSEWSRMAY